MLREFFVVISVFGANMHLPHPLRVPNLSHYQRKIDKNRHASSERPIITPLNHPQPSQQHDLKGRMPERSEWLVPEGGALAKPSVLCPSIMRLKNANIGFLGDCSRVLQTLFFWFADIPGGCASLNPRLGALGLSPSAFNLSGWLPPRLIIAANNRITACAGLSAKKSPPRVNAPRRSFFALSPEQAVMRFFAAIISRGGNQPERLNAEGEA